MAVPSESIVGISSNPDLRPSNAIADTVVNPAWSDMQARDITFNTTGRKPTVFVRDLNPYAVTGNN